MKKKISFLICMTLVFMNLASCAIKKEPVEAEKFKIVASFYPVYAIANEIVQNAKNVELVNLTSELGDCLHDYSLLPSDLETLETANVLIINGENTWKFGGNAEVINASEGFAALVGNEHTWLSFDGAIYQAKKIAQKLGQMNAENAAIYNDNALSFEERMKEKKATFGMQLAAFENKNVAITHIGFEYFLKDLGLNIVAKLGDGHDEEPMPSEIAVALEAIKTTNCGVAFVSEENKAIVNIKSTLEENGQILEIFELSDLTNGDGMIGDFFKQYDDNFEIVKEALQKVAENDKTKMENTVEDVEQ